MFGINLACAGVQYRAFVNSELVNTLSDEKTRNFLIGRFLKIDPRIITFVVTYPTACAFI